MSGHFCRDKKVGEGTKKYGTFYKDYAIESDIMMRAGALVSALIIFLSVRVMKVMALFLLILFINRRNKNGYVSKI